MRLWRLCNSRWAATAFDGEGARLNGGRWNRPGVRVVYVSQTLSLCALEALVHFGIDDAPEDFSALSVNVPDGLGVEQLELSRLPGDWRTYPAPAALQELGTEWARSGRTLLLSVPSAVIPAERNFLINPLHPDFGKLGFGKPEPFSFDPRLLHP